MILDWIMLYLKIRTTQLNVSSVKWEFLTGQLEWSLTLFTVRGQLNVHIWLVNKMSLLIMNALFWCGFQITWLILRPIHTSIKLPTKCLAINLPNVKRAVSLFTRQRQTAATLMKLGVVSSSPPIRVCVVFCANLISI